MDNDKENAPGHISPIILDQPMEATVQTVIGKTTDLIFPAGTSTATVVGDSTSRNFIGTDLEPDQLIIIEEGVERTAGWGKSGHDVEVKFEFKGIGLFSFRSKKDPKKTTTTKTVRRYDRGESKG